MGSEVLSTVRACLLTGLLGAKCGQVRGVNLFGRSSAFRSSSFMPSPQLITPNIDWHLLRNHITVTYLCSGLTGNLMRNRTELQAVCAYIRKGSAEQPRRPFDWEHFVEENFDLEREEEGEDSTWDKEDWYCLDCMMGFLKARFRKWWIAKKTQGACMFRSALTQPQG